MNTRREFLGLGATAAFGAAGCIGFASAAASRRFDDNLTVFVTDIHVGGGEGVNPNPRKRLEWFVDEVLAMRPLPRRVVSLGDLAYLYGLPEDYAASRPILMRLVDAGIEIVFCMGNHDRRSEFRKAWPGVIEGSPVPGKCISVTSLGTSDLVVLDCMQGADNRARADKGPGAGRLSADVFDWCKSVLPGLKRPFLAASHFPVGDLRTGERRSDTFARWLLENVPMCVGYIHGHDHRWRPEWARGSYKSSRTLRTLCLPSNGLWGDIGHAVMSTSGDRAICRLEIRDFFFPREPENSVRPAPWRVKIEENRGASVTFLYNREGA